ncbi:hypothetical protein FQN60_009981, partial [Etheostoma spectabile]
MEDLVWSVASATVVTHSFLFTLHTGKRGKAPSEDYMNMKWKNKNGIFIMKTGMEGLAILLELVSGSVDVCEEDHGPPLNYIDQLIDALSAALALPVCLVQKKRLEELLPQPLALHWQCPIETKHPVQMESKDLRGVHGDVDYSALPSTDSVFSVFLWNACLALKYQKCRRVSMRNFFDAQNVGIRKKAHDFHVLWAEPWRCPLT